jgi:hypothetical protein
MLRIFTILSVLAVVCMGAGALSTPSPNQTFAFNSTVASFFFREHRTLPSNELEDLSEVDLPIDTSAGRLRVLLLQYSSFDSAYANKMCRYIHQELPAAILNNFWDGSSYELTQALSNQDAVVITYPAVGSKTQLGGYGYALEQFARQGGTVIIAGTHEYDVLHDYGLLQVDSARYHQGPTVHCTRSDHPMLAGVSTDFGISTYAYSLKISDPEFVVLGETDGYPMLGYKTIGKGKVIYMGFEYYATEVEPNQILANALTSAGVKSQRSGTLKRTEQILIAGNTVKAPKVNLHIFPNPYMEKGNLEFDLPKPAAVEIFITDETGTIVQVLLPMRNLAMGYYRFELPNVSPGVYFVRCRIGDRMEVKRVVKMSRQ